MFCVYFVNSRLGSIWISVCSANGLLDWWHRHSSQNHFNIHIEMDFPNRLRLQPSALRLVWIFNLSFQSHERWCFTFHSMHYYITLTVIYIMHLHTFHCQWQCKGTSENIIKNSKFIGRFKGICKFNRSKSLGHYSRCLPFVSWFAHVVTTKRQIVCQLKIVYAYFLRNFLHMFFFQFIWLNCVVLGSPHSKRDPQEQQQDEWQCVRNFNYPNDKIV